MTTMLLGKRQKKFQEFKSSIILKLPLEIKKEKFMLKNQLFT